MARVRAIVDDANGTLIVPGQHKYATVTTTFYDESENIVEQRRLFYGGESYDLLPGGTPVALRQKRNGESAPKSK